MVSRRLLIPAGLGLFFLASALVALNLTTSGPGSDSPVTAIVHPTPALTLSVTLNHGRLIPDRPLTVHVELTNTGAVAVPLPADGRCPFIAPLRLEILDAAGRVVWSQPIPLIACAPPLPEPGPKTNLLNPGAARIGNACFQLDRTADACYVLTLADGSYQIVGTYYGYTLPQTAFRISR